MLDIMFHISMWIVAMLYVTEKLWFERGDLEWFRTFFLGYAALYAIAKIIEMP